MTKNKLKGGSITNLPQQYPPQQYFSQYPPQQYFSQYPPQQYFSQYPPQRYPYNPSYNMVKHKEKEQKSKLSFYITIELELFPGTSANMSQKHMVKCQSTFERVREACLNKKKRRWLRLTLIIIKKKINN